MIVVAIMLLLGIGAPTLVSTGSWSWLQNNEPRFILIHERIGTISERVGSLESLISELRRDIIRLDREHVDLHRRVEEKVDKDTRLEMKKDLDETDRRLQDQIERLRSFHTGDGSGRR